MKVLLVTREYPPFIKGGMCRIAEQLVRYSKQSNVELTVIANHPGLGVKKERVNGTVFYRVPSWGTTFISQLPVFGLFASLLVNKLQKDFDVVYSNYSPLFHNVKKPFVAGFVASRYGEYLGCKEAGKPFHALLNKLYIPLDKLLIKKADGIIVNSPILIDEVAEMGSRVVATQYIPSGVDTGVFYNQHERDFSHERKRILCVSRLDSRKGLDILFRAVKDISSENLVELTLCGGGIEKQKLMNLAEALSIEVNFLGQVSYEILPQIYNDADLFVLPSLYEGMPLVALEAMACGTPTIISDASPDIGVPRFNKGDVESLGKMIAAYVSSQERLVELSKLSLKLSQNYSWEKIAGNTFQFLRSVSFR